MTAVLIPVYKSALSALERKSLLQAYDVLARYDLIVVKPASLDLSAWTEEFPRLQFFDFPDEYFRSIGDYNRLLLSAAFYQRFRTYEYVLIYQLDAWVFRDELAEWCARGFDYIGAPWLQKPIYRWPLVRSYMQWLHKRKLQTGKPSKQSLYNRVGNGGLSLRRVESHLRAVLNYQSRIAWFLAQPRSHFYNEDVFWATEVPEFIYPSPEEALRFSFDKYPAYCYQLTGGRLPFGCHSWYKRKMRKFWQPIIGF
ncbi:MAG: hypothetical protein LBM61_02120 [Prevotellaceae bacterium]|jgi:hypothetical protein|nr:hypothetical protein [Prevotellaceae bacterium]